MAVRWSFFAFDWVRFTALEPALRAAWESGDFSALEVPDAQETLEETLEGFDEDSSPEEVCNALVTDLCGVGESAVFEGGLPELIHWVRKQPRGEEPGEALAGLISASPNVAEWFAAEQGLVGMLTVLETQELDALFVRFRRDYKPPASPKGLAALTRRFSPSEPAIEHLQDLMEVIESAATARHGLAAFRED